MASGFVVMMTMSALTAAVAVPCAVALVLRSGAERRRVAGYGRLGTAQRFQAIFGDEAPATARLMMREAIGDIVPTQQERIVRPAPARQAGFAPSI